MLQNKWPWACDCCNIAQDPPQFSWLCDYCVTQGELNYEKAINEQEREQALLYSDRVENALEKR